LLGLLLASPIRRERPLPPRLLLTPVRTEDIQTILLRRILGARRDCRCAFLFLARTS
jgi:hypothetical protein